MAARRLFPARLTAGHRSTRAPTSATGDDSSNDIILSQSGGTWSLGIPEQGAPLRQMVGRLGCLHVEPFGRKQILEEVRAPTDASPRLVNLGGHKPRVIGGPH